MPCVKDKFTADEICLIISSCGLAGVSSLKCGTLEIVFGSGQIQQAIKIEPMTTIPDGSMSDQQPSLDEEFVPSKEEALSHLLAEDPVEFERQLLTEDLTNGTN